MKILILSNLCPPFSIGGYEIACANMAAALHEAGHEVKLATGRSHLPGPAEPSYVERCFTLHWFQPVTIAEERVRAYSLFHASVSDYSNTLDLLRLLRSFAPDVVYAWNLFGIGGIAMLDLLNTLGVPWVLHLMDNMPHHLLAGAPAHVRSLFGGLAGDLFAHGRAIAMSDKLVCEILEETKLTFDGGLDIVPGWIDTRGLPAPREEPAEKPIRFVCAAQMLPHKGIDLILEAAASLREAGLAGFTIDFFGEGEVARYVDIAQRTGVHSIVRFLGQRPQAELLALYPGYHAFLFPTWEREPFGLAPVEAAACGCVPILTRQCGAAERLVDEAHCLKIDRTVDELAAAMRQIVEGAVNLAAIGRRAASAARADLSLERALGRIVAILGETAGAWDRTRASDPRLPLLLHTKHHLALAMAQGQ